MSTEPDPVSASRRGIGKWLLLLPVALVLAVVVTWWALGLRGGMSSGFSDTPVTFEFADTNLLDAVAVLRPGVPVQFEGQPGFIITLKVRGMKEQDAFRWIAALVDQEIVLHDGVIIVREVSWLERSYQSTASWFSAKLGIRLWPDRW